MKVKFRIIFLIIILFRLYTINVISDDFHFAVLSDRLGGADQQAWEQVLHDIERLKPDFVVTVGDMAEAYMGPQYLEKDWKTVQNSFKILTMPLYTIPGNHDITDEITAKIYEKNSGFKRYHSFDYGESHFICIDNSIAENYSEIDQDQKLWLEKDLKDNSSKTNIYVFMHKPFWAHGAASGNPDKMHELFKKYNADAVFAGHWHQYSYDRIDGIEYFLVGSSGGDFGNNINESLGKFYQFLWCKVDGDKLHATIVRSGYIYDKNLVSIKEEMLSFDILNKYIKVNANFKEGEKGKSFNGLISIKNINDKNLETTGEFITRENWEITSEKIKITAEPGKKFEKKIKLKLTGNSIYPLPKFKMKYNFSDEKYVIYENPIHFDKTAEIKKSRKKVEIDGYFKKAEWKDSVVISDFSNYYGEESDIDRTLVFLTRDHDNLFFAAVCYDNEIHKLKHKIKEQDGEVFNDDCIGMLIEGGSGNIYQFYINPNGIIWDQKIDPDTLKGDLSWNSDFIAKSNIQKESWTVEIKIPLKTLGLDHKTKKIKTNIRRKQQRLDDGALWITDWSYTPENYGTLILD